jgi:Tfp pilus assembly major pilin PilA
MEERRTFKVSKIIKKRAVMAIVMAITMAVLSVSAFAVSAYSYCQHNKEVTGTLSYSGQSATASTSMPAHDNATCTVSIKATYPSASGYNTVSGTGPISYSYSSVTVNTTPSYGFTSASSSHKGCDVSFSLFC